MASDKTFYFYFKENMNALGLPAPESLFGKVTSTTANITAIVLVVEKFGADITIGELIGAGTLSEGLLAAAGCTAAFYVGACIGSLAVASAKSYSNFAAKATVGGQSFNEPEFYSVSDISHYARKYKISMGYAVQKTLHKNPSLCKNHLKRR